jgi:predicted transcriptional regulator
LPRPRRSKPDQAPPPLHELEAEIMDEVWRQGETTVKLVMEALNRKARSERAYTTYMTVMRRLDAKGLLSRARSGRHDSYAPRLTRDEYQRRRARAEVQSLVDEFGEVALAHFAKSLEGLDPARRRALQQLAEGE